MHSRELDDLLTLLAMVLMADRHVSDVKVRAFVDAALTVQKSVKLDDPLERPWVENWFSMYRNVLNEILDAADFEHRFTQLLQRLRNLRVKTTILQSMLDIAMSDGVVHVSEQLLIENTFRVWGMESPMLKVASIKNPTPGGRAGAGV